MIPSTTTPSSVSTAQYPWYAEVLNNSLEQGDVLKDCLEPLPPSIGGPIQVDKTPAHNVVVLTQSCDLARDGVPLVMVCPVYTFSTWVKVQKGSTKDNWQKLKNGALVHHHLLNRCTVAGLEEEHLVTDFRQAFSIPWSYARELATQPSRVRLLPPYREQLSQAFARCYMRVGLPSEVDPI